MKNHFYAAVSLLAILCPPAQIHAQSEASIVKAQETRGTPDGRADQLSREMTPAEKISLVSGGGYATHAIDRLGVPSFFMSDGPNGVRNVPQGVTARACAFPSGAALAATWNPDLATAYGKAIALEGRARGTYFQLGPGVNICRVPVNGRNFEYFGEDPFLASELAVNWVRACAAEGVVPTIKHFAANNQETDRNSVDAHVDERTMRELYLPAFKKAVTGGGVLAVMCSYNRLNGNYASANDWLLNQVLKKDWGFQGLVMSDWGASHATTDLARGLDLEMPNGQNLSQQKITAVLAAGGVTQANIDAAVHRILRTAFAEGWLDAGWRQRNTELPMDSDASDATALVVAEEAIVLLKNQGGALPLDRAKVKTIVVVGPNASSATNSVPANIGGGGSGAVETFPTRYASANYFQGIARAAGSNVSVVYLPMPDTTRAAPDFAKLANARTSPRGAPGLTLSVEVAGDGPPVNIAPIAQEGVDVTWQAGQLPFGVPAGRDATLTWSGVLVADKESDWQIVTAGNPVIIIDGHTNAGGAIMHLRGNKPATVKIVARALANPPAGRGGRGGGRRGGGATNARAVRVALVPPAIPDLAQARGADAVIVCVGLNRNVEAEGRDRPFDLPDIQRYLIESAAAANRRVIVVNNSGAGVGMAEWEGRAKAVLQAWYLGQEGGAALGRVLFGDVNPSGRLCSTFDRRFEDNPAYAYYPGATPAGGTYRVEPYTEGIFTGYRGYDKAGKEPLFPFGFGLSYTTFKLDNMKIEKAGDGFKVSLDVKNTGKRDGAEVVQIYVGEKNCPAPRPLRELKGFSKVTVEPGRTRRVEIALQRDAFAYWSPARHDWAVDAGNPFTIEAGVSERDIELRQTLRLDR